MTSVELFFLDSAVPQEVEIAAASGVVSGVTTNPAILHKAAPDVEPIAHMLALFDLFPDGPVFFQLHAADTASAEVQVEQLLRALGARQDRLVFKLPAQRDWFSLGAGLAQDGHEVAFTAVYHPGQFLAAAQAGARYVIPYVDRARRLRPGHEDVVAALRAVAVPDTPRILAASIKSVAQAVEAFRNGADAITAPWQVLNGMMQDELTDSAVEEFRAHVPT